MAKGKTTSEENEKTRNTKIETKIEETENTQQSKIDSTIEENENKETNKPDSKSETSEGKKLIIGGIISIIIAIISSFTTYFITVQKCKECSNISNPQSNDKVIMIGSGTVFRFFNEIISLEKEPNGEIKPRFMTDRLRNQLGVGILEGSTGVGEQIFFATKDDNTILMSSKKIRGEDLISKSKSIYEIYLGNYNLQLLLIEPDKAEKYFQEISNDNKIGGIEINEFIEKIDMLKQKYQVCIGGELSATNKAWQKKIGNDKIVWNSKEICRIEVSDLSKKNKTFDKPTIFLGSNILNSDIKTRLHNDLSSHPINLTDKTKQIDFGLYLYGFFNDELYEKTHLFANEKIKVTLEFVMKTLKSHYSENKQTKFAECIENQMTYFGLNLDKEITKMRPDDDGIYRLPIKDKEDNYLCSERPPE